MAVNSSPGAKVGLVSIHWFRQDLRLHDNPSLLESVQGCDLLYPIFIFDGTVASTGERCEFPRMRFLVESLRDLDEKFQKHGGRLFSFRGPTIDSLRKIIMEWGVNRLTYEEEPEALWRDRDNAVIALCKELKVTLVTRVGHTLWDPFRVIEANGGTPPLTYNIFNHVVSTLGKPDRPIHDIVFEHHIFNIPDNFEEKFSIPSFTALGYKTESEAPDLRFNRWVGGETTALRLERCRIMEEETAFAAGIFLPNQYQPDLLGPPKSMSAHLKFGCLSIRKFYWDVQDAYVQATGDLTTPPLAVVGQLLWREYFYTMSANNPNYNKILNNPICLPIEWYENKDLETKYEMGLTGYPFVDAIMNQLRLEGWVHHVGRHMVASYLCRGDLWLSWVVGLEIFEKYLLDYDWSISAGNWMWTSSSAFEKALDCPKCFDPVKYGQRMDPTGEYTRRYVPALKHMPVKYLFCPWLAPRKVQEEARCIVGKDYPIRINDHKESARENAYKMEEIRSKMIEKLSTHCAPSTADEIRHYSWLPSLTPLGSKCTGDSLCAGIDSL